MAIERAPNLKVGNLGVLKRYRPPRDKVAKYYNVKPRGGETLGVCPSN